MDPHLQRAKWRGLDEVVMRVVLLRVLLLLLVEVGMSVPYTEEWRRIVRMDRTGGE